MIVGESSASPYLRRAVRNSMGTIFKLPVIESGKLSRMIAELRSRGVRCIAAHPQPALEGLLERFEGCVCGHEGLPSKPSPDLYKRALLNMELLPEEVLAVEDSPNGIAADNSRHRLSSPHFSFASALRSMINRSVSTGPGLIATTRSPSFGAPLPSARVNAISDALPAAPAI